MKHLVILAACLVPAAAFAQESRTYTNADLVKIQVPGAYTNEDLKRLPSTGVTVQKTPKAAAEAPLIVAAPSPQADAFQAYYSTVRADRDVLASELEYELARVEFSKSAFAGGSEGYDIRLGYGAKSGELIRELMKRVALFDARLDAVADEARRAGVTLDRR